MGACAACSVTDGVAHYRPLFGAVANGRPEQKENPDE